MQWLDKNGSTLRVGDTVRYGVSEGEVLILEQWPIGSAEPTEAGLYVSRIGWGDCRAVSADSVEKVDGAGA